MEINHGGIFSTNNQANEVSPVRQIESLEAEIEELKSCRHFWNKRDEKLINCRLSFRQ